MIGTLVAPSPGGPPPGEGERSALSCEVSKLQLQSGLWVAGQCGRHGTLRPTPESTEDLQKDGGLVLQCY